MYGAQEGERQLVSLLVLHTRLLCGPLPKDPCASVALCPGLPQIISRLLRRKENLSLQVKF